MPNPSWNTLRTGLLVLAALSAAPGALAVDLWSDEDGSHTGSLDATLKATGLGSHMPHDPLLFDDPLTGTGLLRARLGLNARFGDLVSGELAYEHRLRYASDAGSGLGGLSGVLPAQAEASYRLTQLDWEIWDHGARFSHRHEFDRGLVALHPKWGEIVVGRQAIGLGRGVMFSAVDMFAPFSVLEVDREWRRGVDAVRAEYRFSDTGSAEIIAVGAPAWDEAALVGRVRGYLGEVDGEILFGKRAKDVFGAVVVSAVLGEAEVHGELAGFATSDALPDGALFGNDHFIAKAVLGASYTFNIGNGLTLMGEYHYNGFGLRDPKDAFWRLLDAGYQERLLRGDMQILGQHALGATLTYPVDNTWNLALSLFQSPADGSGLVSPRVQWDGFDFMSVILAGFVPWGAGPSGVTLHSEYGAVPMSLFLQVNLYF